MIGSYAVAFRTIVAKEVRRFLRIWLQTVLPPMVTTALYFIIFGNLIGDRIGTVHGVSYIDYMVPGIILMAIIQNAYANVVSSFYGAKFSRYVEELLIAPVPNVLILLGFVSGGILRGLTVGAAVSAVAMFFTRLSVHDAGIILAVVLLTSLLFAIGGFINAIYAKGFDDISIIPTFVLTPLTYLGGIFYSVDMLPEFWRQVSLANPILYMINAFRYGMLGVSDVDVGMAFLIVGAFSIALFLYALHLLNKGVGLRS